MSDSTIDDALKLLETGRGNPDRLKKIIESFQKRSLISLEDRKYVEALVSQYLAPRQRVKMKKLEPKKEQTTSFSRINKTQYSDYKPPKIQTSESNSTEVNETVIPELQNSVETNSPSKPSSFDEYEKKYLQRVAGEIDDSLENETSLEEKFVTQIERGVPKKKKSSSFGKNAAIIGIISIIVIGGGAGVLLLDFDSTDNTTVLERATCDNTQILVSATKIPGFPDPEKDLQHYLDRYNNEPSYADWFDRNFQGQTIEEVLVKQKSVPASKIPGFPDPEKDLQHYLDRYNNEPSYADWFDRNFQGQTIEEAVC